MTFCKTLFVADFIKRMSLYALSFELFISRKCRGSSIKRNSKKNPLLLSKKLSSLFCAFKHFPSRMSVKIESMFETFPFFHLFGSRVDTHQSSIWIKTLPSEKRIYQSTFHLVLSLAFSAPENHWFSPVSNCICTDLMVLRPIPLWFTAKAYQSFILS